MELHAMHRQRFVAHPHDLVIIGPGGDLQTFRQCFALDHQRVIARRGERVGQAVKHAGVVVMDRRGLTVHQLFGVNDASAEGLANALVPEAYTQNRNLSGEVLDRRDRDAGFVRCTRAGRHHDVLRVERGDLCHADFIVAMHHHLRTQFGEILHQVVGEGIIIVDHQKHVCSDLIAGEVHLPIILKATASATLMPSTAAERIPPA